MNQQQGPIPVFQQPFRFTPGQIFSPPPNQVFSDPPPAYSPPGQGSQYNQPPPPPQQSVPTNVYMPELDPLRQLDHLFIKQDITDIFFNSNNHFKVISPNGQPLYAIVEKTGMLMRLFGGQHQSFKLIMKDMNNQDVLLMEGSSGFFGGGAGVNVSYKDIFLGSVRQGGDICNPQYDILDQSGNVVLIVKSQDGCCCMGVGGVAEFFILTTSGNQIGRIGKEWGGLGRELFTNADTFGINFPMDLHVAMKAVLLAATIMIDFQFFERR